MRISFECIVRSQDAVGTADHEFYFSLPAFQLLRGQEVTLTAPLQTDDIDAAGTLTIRFFPKGGIK